MHLDMFSFAKFYRWKSTSRTLIPSQGQLIVL